MPKYFAKKELKHRFIMIKQCYMSTHALATQIKTEKNPLINGDGHIHSAATVAFYRISIESYT